MVYKSRKKKSSAWCKIKRIEHERVVYNIAQIVAHITRGAQVAKKKSNAWCTSRETKRIEHERVVYNIAQMVGILTLGVQVACAVS